MPEYVGIGDENEAIDYVAGAHEAWIDSNEAVQWLVEVMARQLPRFAHADHPSARSRRP
jgi:hypothetical protein